MLINVIAMQMMEMVVVQIIYMIAVTNGFVPAIFAMFVFVLLVYCAAHCSLHKISTNFYRAAFAETGIVFKTTLAAALHEP